MHTNMMRTLIKYVGCTNVFQDPNISVQCKVVLNFSQVTTSRNKGHVRY